MLGKFILAISLCIQTGATLAAQQEWRFRVYLDEKEIGYHDFVLEQAENRLTLHSEARFEYRLMFVKLYGYTHDNTETWRGDCLTAINSSTDANGRPYEVSGALEGDSFILEGAGGEVELPPCNMSFAYWNPAFLQQDRLINTQSGELVDVEVSEPERVEIEVRGVSLPALHYRLSAGDMEIELWYSENNEWLALETEARGGKRLRYELL
jgi:hypothetical protein